MDIVHVYVRTLSFAHMIRALEFVGALSPAACVQLVVRAHIYQPSLPPSEPPTQTVGHAIH